MNDPEIRALLLPELAGGLVIDELPLGHRVGAMTRADLVHVTGELMHGYELKGDGDTLKRVPLQVACYGAVFDRVTFVVTSKHLAKMYLPGMLPEWAGIAEAGPEGINFITPPQPVPTLDRDQLGTLLWQKEVLEFLARYGIKPPCRHRVWECRELLESAEISLDSLRAYVRQCLTKRYAAGCRLRDKRAAHAALVAA
jgi:hypothetical protein